MNFIDQLAWVKPLATFFIIIIGLFLTCITFLAWVNRGEKNKLYVIQNFEFPPEVSVGIKEQYPHLSDKDIKLALEQLRLYFLICWNGNKEEVVMPSRLVDTSWHCFILQTRSYQSFCQQAFDGFLHHVPHRLVASSQASENAAENKARNFNLEEGAKVFQAALALTDIVSSLSKTATTSLRVPMLFAIDHMMKIPDGHMYTDEALQLLATFDWRTSRLSGSGEQSQSGGDSLSLGCGDGSGACGSCAGGH